ncbi:GATA-type zinc finger protein 1 [Elgaria multicarinata webbii]|uniref:GATA-type zinc finger protein 1 n=1 Tax=Elgaria multicarinata webbii TaxID=159646 RepID=UPI002FCD65F5
MAGELFVDGQPPEFSVLLELLCPPCLESEPSNGPPRNPGGVGLETAANGESRFEPFSSMACCLQSPDSKAFSFLQETAQLFSQPEPISSKLGRPLRQAGLAMSPRCSATAPQGDCFSPALASFSALDALSLISLHCSSLESEPLNRIESPEAAQESPPSALSKDHSSKCLWSACVEEPRAAQLQVTSIPDKFEPQGLRRRVSRKQPTPRRSCESLDPAFRGVAFQMQLLPCQSDSEGCRLFINARYSSEKLRKRRRVPLAKEECRAGSSKEEEGCLSTHRNRCCASCKTWKTPLWRVAEDGTPLCNACGIRYKKYRIRCFQCWYIPKHGGKPYSYCSNCEGKLHVGAAQQNLEKDVETS